MRLKDKVVIITGASSGMGNEASLLFAKEGAKVVAVARRKNRLEELATKAENTEGKIIPLQADISDENDLDNVIKFTMDEFGKIDILINNAGILDDYMPAGDMTDDMWDSVLNVNLTAPMKLIRGVLPIMIKQNKGNIINVASVGGLHGVRGGAAYVTSKHGLLGLTKNTAYVYADKGIRCNAVCPGGVATEISAKEPNELGLSKLMSGVNTSPREGTSEEIANILLFLSSDESSLINGASIVADSGWTAY